MSNALPRSAVQRPVALQAPDPMATFRKRIVGLDTESAIFGGRRAPHVNFDNAATTPALRDVVEAVTDFLEWYGSIHRGTGAKSYVSTQCYDRCRQAVAEFVGADPDRDVVIFTRSTTDSINKAARTLAAGTRPLVLCTRMEHHSNLLPWREHCRVECVGIRRDDGSLDLDHLADLLKKHAGDVSLVAVTGASNVTGLMPPVHSIARLAHERGAEILVDAAQLAPHGEVRMGAPDDPERLDYLVFSAHKMYAPFGAGVLVGPRAAFERTRPESVGGGAVRLVTPSEIIWADLPAREEPGSPNVVGALALAKAMQVLQQTGMGRVARHEASLREKLVQSLRGIEGIRVYGDPAPGDHGQVGVVGFSADRMSHGLMAAALGHEWGIGVRHGCFCAHSYIMGLMGVDEAAVEQYKQQALEGDVSHFPGMVRLSVAAYNTADEVAYVVGAIRSILEAGPRDRYSVQPRTGEFLPAHPLPPPRACFLLGNGDAKRNPHGNGRA